MNNNIAIRAEGISKKYTIGKQGEVSLRGALGNLLSKKNTNKEDFWALKDINFEIKKGEAIGVIGKNGAGKSTLLKILSQITKPTSGRIELNGRVSSLLEVGTGFHPELTGRENIFLNGTILGMSRKEVKRKFDEIVEFSGVGKFIDTPVKHYSSGMYVRLAFAVAAHLEPEILIIDEVLAVGDAEFQKKCLGKMEDVSKNQGRTVLFVSHNMAAINALCKSGVLMNKGELVAHNNIDKIIEQYLISSSNSGIYIPEKVNKDIEVAFKSIEVQNDLYRNQTEFTCLDKITIKFEFEINEINHPYSVFAIIKNKYGSPVFSAELPIKKEVNFLIINPYFLTRGVYHIHSFIHIPNVKQIDVAFDVCHFTITDTTSAFAIHGDYEYGNVFGNYFWK